MGSELIASFKFKKCSKITKTQKQKSGSEPCTKTTISNLSKRTVTKSPSKATRDCPASNNPINRKFLGCKFENNSCKRLASLKHKGKTGSLVNPKGHDKLGYGGAEIKKHKKRRKEKSRKDKVEPDEASRLQRRSRYLLIKIKLEQNLIDAYSGEGWKGQSREKIRPEKELQRAKKQIMKCKLGIRDALQQLDSLSSVGCIEGSVIAPDGSVHHEHIICAKCKLREAFPDNDILLCDGTCNCAFHQKCLDPPLDTESIPPGEQGWFCRFCQCKMEIIEAMNAHIGTHFPVNSNWQNIFQDEAAFRDDGAELLNQEDWPSDDAEDVDYDPERVEHSCDISGAGSDDNDDASTDGSSFTSLSWSSDEAFIKSNRWDMDGNGHKDHLVDSSIGSDETSDGEIINGRRQRAAVDYKKLYDEMFGKDALEYEQISEDEDWGPVKRRRREKESDAVNSLMFLYDSQENYSNTSTREAKSKPPSYPKIKRPLFRLPPNAVEKLRQVFAENELPSRTVRLGLAKELGLELEKVNKWFKNARYIALKGRKAERTDQPRSSLKVSDECRNETGKDTTIDFAADNDALTETMSGIARNLQKVIQRNDSKSLRSCTSKGQRNNASLVSAANSDQASPEFSDDISLKKLLEAKMKKDKKKVNFVAVGLEAAEAEMERLCRAKSRLEHLMQKLSRIQSGNTRKSNKMPDESVIYIPIAALEEKS